MFSKAGGDPTGGTGTAIVTGDPHPASVASLPGCSSVDFSWDVTCTGSGTVIFLVTPSGTDENTGKLVLEENIEPDEVTVHQEWKAHLRVDITSPLGGETYQPGNTFPVNVTVHNDG